MYAIRSYYEAMTAVQLSKWLEEQFPAYRFVPVFWLESEDHDFLEINNRITSYNVCYTKLLRTQRCTVDHCRRRAADRCARERIRSLAENMAFV